MRGDWVADPAVLREPPGWMPQDAIPLGEGRFRWFVGRTEVRADFEGVKQFIRDGVDVECACDDAVGVSCQRHS